MMLIEEKEKELDSLIAEVLEWKKHTNILEMFFGSIRSVGATTYTNELRFQNAVCYLLEKQGMKPEALSDVQEKWAKRFEDMLDSIKDKGKDIQNYIPTFEDIKYMYLFYPFKSYYGSVFDVLKEMYGEPIPVRQKELERTREATDGILFTRAIYAMSREELLLYLVKSNEENKKQLEELKKMYENTGFDYKTDKRYVALTEKIVSNASSSLSEMSISKLRNKLFDSFIEKSDTFKYFAYLTKLRLDISCLGKAIGKECLFDDNALIELYKNSDLFYEPRFNVDTFCATANHLAELERYEYNLTGLENDEEFSELRTVIKDQLNRLVIARKSLSSLKTAFEDLEDLVNRERKVLEDYENLPDEYKNSRRFKKKFLKEHGVDFSRFCDSVKFNQDKCEAMREDIVNRRGDCRTAVEDFCSKQSDMFEKIYKAFPLFTMEDYKLYFSIDDRRDDKVFYYDNAEKLANEYPYSDIFDVAEESLELMIIAVLNRLSDSAEVIINAFFPGANIHNLSIEDVAEPIVSSITEYAPVVFDDITAIKELADGYFDSEVVKATNSEDLSSAATREKVFRKVDLGGKEIYENN